MRNESSYSVCIVGCGNIGGGFDVEVGGKFPLTHAGAFFNHPGFNLTACVDPSEENVKSFAKKWSVSNSYSNIEMLAGQEFDVVVIASPTEVHYEQFLFIINELPSPKIIFSEKPLTNDLNQAREVLSLASKKNITLAVNFNRRWDKQVSYLKSEKRMKDWGGIRSISCFYNKGVNNNGSHLLDVLLALFSDINVIATGYPVYDFFESDPTVPALLESSDGLPIVLNHGHAADFALFEIHFVTEKGVMIMENGGLSWRLRKASESKKFPGYKQLMHEEVIEGGYLSTMTHAVENIYDFLTTGKKIISTGFSAIKAQELSEKLRLMALSMENDR